MSRTQGIYCGNNANNQDVLNGTKIVGNKYQCFKKGVGRGLREPILKYDVNYNPIDKKKIYCGNKTELPPGMDRFGCRGECLRKGFGVGQKIRFSKEGLQKTPVIMKQDNNWYKILLLGPVSGIFTRR